MRSFPRTARYRMATVTAVCAMAAGVLSVPTANADDLKDRQKQVEQKIEHAHSDLEDSSSKLRNATLRLQAARQELDGAKAELAEARTRLAAARVRDQEMKLKLAAAVERLATAEADLESGRAALEVQRDVVTDVITTIYQGGDPQLLAFASLLNAETSSDLTRRDELQNVIVGRETTAYDDLRAAEVLLEVRQDQVAEAKDEVAVQRQDAAEHLVTMKGLHESAQQARARVRELVRDRRDARQSASKARQHDRYLLARLKKQEQRIKQRILAAARRAARSSNGGYRGDPGGLFLRPVPGIVTSSYGYRTHPIFGYYGLHNGTDFRAPCGTSLRAIGDGRVISRYYSAVYGNRLVVGVGMVNGSYVTAIYNHLSRYSVGVGQSVSRGQVLGAAGSTGWSTACHLHFTMMAGGRTVDPMNWL